LFVGRLLKFHVVCDMAQDVFRFVAKLFPGHARRHRQDRASKRLPLHKDGFHIFNDEIG